MVVKIYAAAPSCSSAVGYNERKVAEGSASVLSSSAIRNPENPMETFLEFERGSLRCQNMSFHASVNPGEGEHMTDEKIREFVKDYMEKMGYGNQPFIVYKHTDIARTHYHIVSVRVDKDGHKIPDSHERRRSQQALKELAEKYDYIPGKQKTVKTAEEEPEGKKAELKDFNPYDGFDPAKGHITDQIDEITNLALKYHFCQPEHFDLVMEHFGVKVIRNEAHGFEWITLQGLDPKTKEPCTPVIEPSVAFLDLNECVNRRADFCKTQIKTREKEKVDNLAMTARKVARSETHFLNYLKKCGITAVISKNVKGNIFGVTFIDHKNKCVFKASELKNFKASDLENDRLNKWYDEKKSPKEVRYDRAIKLSAKMLIKILGSEHSRHYEDDEIMRQGQKKND